MHRTYGARDKTGSWRASHQPVNVTLAEKHLSVSLPSPSGHEVQIRITADYEVTTAGVDADAILLKRVLEISRGSVPLLVCKTIG
jgi:hypothetical protein